MTGMELVVLSGLSGAGKTQAIHALEDMGFYCVDNMPPSLIPKFAEVCVQSRGKLDRVAIVADVRAKDSLQEVLDELDSVASDEFTFRILFLDTDDKTLITRYKETRRKHPLAERSGSTQEAIRRERELLGPIRQRADMVIDTTYLSAGQLREKVISYFSAEGSSPIMVSVMSFGFKYGLPMEADLVFDVRCLPNPFYIPELKEHTGLDAPVRDYVMQFEQSRTLAGKLLELIDYQLPLFIEEGKGQLTVAVGCTGGKHRSVTFAELIYHHLQGKGYRAVVSHRDIAKRK